MRASLFIWFILAAFAMRAQVPDTLYKDLKWRNVGPFRGGRSNTITGVVGNDQRYYAGYTGGGVWRTDDAGNSWHNISDSFFHTGSIGMISVAESDPNVVYVGTGEHAVRGVMTTYGDGVYKSTDGGATWKHIGLEKTRHISDIAIHPHNPDIVYVAAQGTVHGPNNERGVYKSTDGGASWTRVLYINDSTGISSLQMDMTNPRILYAAAWEHRRYPWTVVSGGPGSGIWKSSDEGKTWERLKNGLPEKMGKIGLAVSRANPERVFAIIETDRAKAGLYRSDDGGKTWALHGGGADLVSRSWYYTKVTADPKNPDVVYVLNYMVQKSIDGGNSFHAIKIQHGDTHELWINPSNPGNTALADDGGAQITSDGAGSWSTLNNQPTAQFYRVNVDNQFPYKLYGGQQDNTSVIISSRNNMGEITERDWIYGPGGESAYLVFDPNDPTIVFGGGYQGFIDRMDMKSHEVKSVQAYPSNMMGNTPANMKYRFNWNFPVMTSPHDPHVVYHAGNVLFRSTNAGLKWEVISPDLTRNEKSKQIDGGMPFTNEGAGGEVYNTIYYVMESTLDKGEIWTASDDGLVYLTRDDGAHWTNVTPAALPECLIQSIELSSFDRGTAYITGTRYKFNDFGSYTYKTVNYGKTWTKIATGIRTDDFLKVIREDTRNKNILYGGAERGFYISFNAGATWQPMQLNLPVVPVTDLMIHGNDLVAATAGRAFWILDDIGVIQQSGGNVGAAGNVGSSGNAGSSGKAAADSVKLFHPKPAYRYGAGTPLPAKDPQAGQDAPTGVIFDYVLPEIKDKDTVTLSIYDADGKLVRSYSNQKDSTYSAYPGGPPPAPLLKAARGHNRFLWDLRRSALTPDIKGQFMTASYTGSMVRPGEYKAVLKAKGKGSETAVDLLPNPLIDGLTASDWTDQNTILEHIGTDISDVHGTINSMRKVRQQLNTQAEVYTGVKDADTLVKESKRIAKSLEDWESKILETRSKGGQDVINYAGKLNIEFFSLYRYVDVDDPRVTAGARERLADLEQQWAAEKAKLAPIKDSIAKYNALVREKKVDAVEY
ncbi:MAG TPA: hypothetical protein VMH27_19180 [Puia sp.]|nr:hypothetical protein [Puia sp.]